MAGPWPLEYSEEGNGPWIVDLVHKTRWDLQSRDIGGMTPCDVAVPETPGEGAFWKTIF